MATDRWSRGNEYKTFVTSRRDGVFEQRAEGSVFSLKYDRPSNFGTLAMVGGGRSRDQQEHAVAEEEVVSHYDIPLSLQLRWKTMVRGTRPFSVHHLHDQFEFTVKQVAPEQTQIAAPLTSPVSSADKPPWSAPALSRSAFQPPRNEDQKVWVKEEHFISRIIGSDAVLNNLQYPSSRTEAVLQPTYSKVYAKEGNDTPVDSMMNSRSSSFESRSSSMCESAGHERETGEEDQQTISDQESSKKKASSDARLQNTTCSGDDSVTLKVEASPEPLWLRLAFKLKSLFGGKKLPKCSGHELNLVMEHPRPIQYSERRRTHTTTHPTSWKASRHSWSQRDETPALKTPRHSYIGTSTASCKGTRAFASRRSTPASIQRFNAKDSSTKESSRREVATIYSECLPDTTFDNTNGRGRDHANMSKMQEHWVQYMKILKPPYGSTSPHGKPESQAAAVARQSPKTKEKNPKYCPKFTPASADEPVRTKSMPAIDKAQVRPNYSSSGAALMSHFSPRLVPNRSVSYNSTAGSKHSLPICAVHRAGLHSIDATTMASPKLSNNKLSMSLKVKSSPKPVMASSPRRSNDSNSSTISELHSSVQGAIAHCKRSHSAHLSQASDDQSSSLRPATQVM